MLSSAAARPTSGFDPAPSPCVTAVPSWIFRLASECARLSVGVGDEEVDTVKIGVDHVVDGIAAGAADTDYGDAGPQFLHGLRNRQVDGHESLPSASCDHVAACAGNAHGLAAVGRGVRSAPL